MTGAARGAGLAADPAEPAKPADLADPAGPASPADPPDLLRAALAAALQAGQPLAGTGQVQNLHRLSGGASQETWAFDWLPAHPAGAVAASAAALRPLILRRAPPGAASRHSGAAGLAAEAALITLAGQAALPVPEVVLLLRPGHRLGDGFIMQRLPGQALGRRIASAHRPALAWQCGQVLARIHALPLARLPALRRTQPAAEVAHLRQWHARHGTARPVFQLALRWLHDRAPADVAPTLVHGDFRNGNLLVDLDLRCAAPLTGVLDWELAHLGDPMADLGWLMVNAWCFGQAQRPVGGFGLTDELFDGYRAAGGVLDAARVRWWQVLGSLRWGVMCESMGHAWASGAEPVLEKAAIGRRASENEIDLLALIAPGAAPPPTPASR